MSPRTAVVRGPLLLATALALLSTLSCIALADVEPIAAPANPALADYFLTDHTRTLQSASNPAHSEGLIPEPFQLPAVTLARLSAVQASALPSAYDLRPLNKLTAIRDQGSCGSCWSFATMGSLESSLMPAESWDFSENNLKNQSGFDYGCCSGGNRAMSTAYLTRWGGPIAESDDRYNAGSCTSPTNLLPKKHVQEVIFLPNRSGPLDNDALKQAVMTYGAVYTTYYHSDSYYNSAKAAYCYNGTSRSNHAVCIVGWDDNFPASSFGAATAGNGAFLIRNSWGAYWGMSGYFWMSYYDNVLGKTENAVFRAEANTNYDQIYQYDPLGWISNTGYGTNTAWFANVFTATGDSSVAAASWYAPTPGASYSLYVYTDPTSGPTNPAGPAATISGAFGAAGYHTVSLPNNVPIRVGQKFSVVVKLTTPGYTYPICLERPYSGYASTATASTGQSYMSSSGTSWMDVAGYYANTNVCLKAFTSASGNPAPGPGAMSVTPSSGLAALGAAGGPFSPSAQSYTVTNTGQSPINWTASASQPWVGLTSTGGTLAAGATTAVSISINSSANNLAAGTYTGSVSLTNTTNGDGNTARTVSLTINSTAPAAGALSITPSTGLSASGTVGGPFGPTSQSYTLTNTGQGTISWTAGATQPWVGLSSRTGTLAAGASATVIVSINSAASTLLAGAYGDAVSFTNTTNGVGSTTRSVALSISAVAPPPSGSYSVAPTTYAWIDPTYHQRVYLSDDSVSYGYYMPFAFTFYGKRYTGIYVGSNGLLGFTSSGMYLPTNGNLPSTTWPNCAIYPYWENLNPGVGGSVRIAYVGTAPNRKIVISWVGVPSDYAPATKYTFQALLCEGSNDIIFQYQNVAPTDLTYGAGAGATIGIENETGTQACKFSYNTRSLSNNMAIRFTAQPTAAISRGRTLLWW